MFKDFANVWTPIELARRVKSRPVSLTIAGERVVLFRGADGKIAALIDRCPHRGVALSLGKVTQQGALQCPFHGWEFDGQGKCVHVPLSPAAKCELLGATALPVRELGGFIWIFTAPVSAAQGASIPEPVAPIAMVDPAFRRYDVVTHWKAHWTRAMENMLDMPHVPFVHRRTIGFALRRRMRRSSELTVTWTPNDDGGRVESSLDGQPPEGSLEFHRPNRMTLHIPVPGKRMRINVFCVPVGPSETRMMVTTSRDFAHWNPLVKLFDRANRLILLEDRAIVESSDPAEVPSPSQERSVVSDKPTLQFRKYYSEVLRGSSAT